MDLTLWAWNLGSCLSRYCKRLERWVS